jgi:hypothetical protein
MLRNHLLGDRLEGGARQATARPRLRSPNKQQKRPTHPKAFDCEVLDLTDCLARHRRIHCDKTRPAKMGGGGGGGGGGGERGACVWCGVSHYWRSRVATDLTAGFGPFETHTPHWLGTGGMGWLVVKVCLHAIQLGGLVKKKKRCSQECSWSVAPLLHSASETLLS